MRNYLEYVEDGYDLLDVLPKVIGFFSIDSKREDIKAKVRVFHTTQFTNDKIDYELLICDISIFHKLGIFKDGYLVYQTMNPLF